mgnify:FL=1
MNFEYTSYTYVSEDDLNEMVKLVKDGYNVKNAILEVANYWDDDTYYSLDLIIDKLIEEVLKRASK